MAKFFANNFDTNRGGGFSITGSQAHSNLQRKLHGPDAVRKISLPYVSIQHKEFDREGYTTWMMATNTKRKPLQSDGRGPTKLKR
jgi:hypothetical protein